MRVLIFGSEDYKNAFSTKLGELLGLAVFTDPEDAVDSSHILNYNECSETARSTLNADIVIWIDLGDIIDNPPQGWDIRLQDTLTEKHINKLALGIKERYGI